MHFITAPSPWFLSPHLTPFLFPSLYFRSGSTGKVREFAVLNEPGSVLDSLWKGNCFYKGLCWSCSGFLRRCKDWEGEFSSLESEIFEFMQSSDKPQAFPTKEELLAAGRADLVNAIVSQGGWLAFGWDLTNGFSEIHDFEDRSSERMEDNAARASGVASRASEVASNSSEPDKSVEIEADESGIDGILNRLEKQRSSSLGLGFREEDNISTNSNEDEDERDHRTTTDAIVGLDNNSRTSPLSPASRHLSGSENKHDQQGSQLGTENLSNPFKLEMWRSWIIQRNGLSDADFEDAEIVPGETQKGGMGGVSGQPDILNGRDFSSELTNGETRLYSLDGNANHNDIKSRIQHLESELSSVLHMLRSSADTTTMKMDQKSSSDDLSKLSDAWEFQENEIMNARNRLRSIQAKLAVLEGKMALAITDAHKLVEKKQRKIDSAKRALQMLKTTCVVWPNNASEVFLTGSFDGWSTKRKMERISSGMFSVNLQLYPGRYEMKFIVDGEWKIDPLRPVVVSNGYENNLLIICD